MALLSIIVIAGNLCVAGSWAALPESLSNWDLHVLLVCRACRRAVLPSVPTQEHRAWLPRKEGKLGAVPLARSLWDLRMPKLFSSGSDPRLSNFQWLTCKGWASLQGARTLGGCAWDCVATMMPQSAGAGPAAGSRLPHVLILSHLLICCDHSSAFACSLLCFHLALIIYLDCFIFAVIFVLLGFFLASFRSSSTNSESRISGACDWLYSCNSSNYCSWCYCCKYWRWVIWIESIGVPCYRWLLVCCCDCERCCLNWEFLNFPGFIFF